MPQLGASAARALRYDAPVRGAGLLLTLPPRAVVPAAAALALAGCVREPAEALCPELAAGDLVVTEVRGTQSPEDADGPWIELYNASGRTIDLIGIELRFRNGNGVPAGAVLIRRNLPAEPDSYTVLGSFDQASWLDTAALDVATCGATIDRVSYSLPRMGTFSLGGTPDADRNDFPMAWCNDRTQVGTSFPGTPGNPNIACP